MVDTIEYLPDLTRRAKRLSWQNRTAFAAWCADRMLEAFSEPLVPRVGPELVMALHAVMGAIWLDISNVQRADRALLSETKHQCIHAVWQRGDDVILETGCIETMEAIVAAIKCFEGEASGKSAARAGESLMNRINVELDFGDEHVDSVFRHPSMLAEVAKQIEYLQLLERTGAVSPSLRNLLR